MKVLTQGQLNNKDFKTDSTRLPNPFNEALAGHNVSVDNFNDVNGETPNRVRVKKETDLVNQPYYHSLTPLHDYLVAHSVFTNY